VRDPHGLGLALVESDSARSRPFTPWTESPVPPEYQIRGLHGARLRERELEPTVSFLTRQMGFRQLATDGPWQRYGVLDGSSGQHVDLLAVEERAGHWGIGAVHHLAFRVDDEAHQMAIRRQVEMAVAPTPVVDRFWFKSVYFREPGGVLFELATDGPGFAVDEDPAHLGEALVLPPWLEEQRRTIAANLPPLSPPVPETFR
jgi:glyoxalase family protein